MRVIEVIEDSDVIKKILKHLGLWDGKRKPQPTANALLSMLSPHATNSLDPVRMFTSGTLIALPKPTFKKNLNREDRPPISKFI